MLPLFIRWRPFPLFFRDYTVMTFSSDLTAFGWSPFFQSQLSLDDLECTVPARVTAVHRGAWDVAHPNFEHRVSPLPAFALDAPATVGDWLLLDQDTREALRLLERKSVFQRRAAGVESTVQLISANVDTVFVVSSCNQDFNIARLERYLVLAHDAGATPVVVLTKADLTDDEAGYRRKAESLTAGLMVECVDAREMKTKTRLAPWCTSGQTVALLGSSGVGKSTLVNTLTGTSGQATAGIREDDAKGRHTTSGRSLHRLESGGWLIDTPGMRELQLVDVEDGLSDVFADIMDLASQCRFTDCQHETEPDCAVIAAIESGNLDADRLARYRKLQAEDAFNTQSVAERRASDKAFGKLIKSVIKEKKRQGKL